ncbi:hypothetical protein HWV62_24794 [Athelia sp. TMB]|nr:hypothetical protein HWV62_24794 [Athelia sp. TMB]
MDPGLVTREGLLGELEETAAKLLRQGTNIGGLGRVGDGLGHGGDFEANRWLVWLKSDWKHRGAARRWAVLAIEFGTLDFVFVAHRFHGIIERDIGVHFFVCGLERDANDLKSVVRR